MNKAVIFDMDGLLVDTEPLWDEVDSSLLQKRGYFFTDDLRRRRTGTGQHSTVELFKEEFKLPDDISVLLSERQEIFGKLIKLKLNLMRGAEALIGILISMNFKLGIATGGHDEKRVKEILKYFGIEKYFHSITTSHEVKNGKPAPDIFLLEAKKLKTDPSRCLVLEDSPSGIAAAKAAGMKAIAVNDTTIYKQGDFENADLYVRSMEELNKELIEGIFNK